MRILRWLMVIVLGVGVMRAEKVASMPKPTGYVDDYAGVIDADAKVRMEAECVEVHDRTKAQVFVVSVKSLEGEPVEQFANELFHTWKIGEKGTDRGVLLLLATGEHKYRIEVGYGLEGILNDAKVGDIGRGMVPQLKAKAFGPALEGGLDAIVKVIESDGKAETPVEAGEPGYPSPGLTSVEDPTPAKAPLSKWAIALPFIFFFGAFGFIAFVIWLIASGKRRSGGGSSGSDDSWMSSSSSSSDDSSSSSDSSSDSFSGGDGGDSGGGGASGDY